MAVSSIHRHYAYLSVNLIQFEKVTFVKMNVIKILICLGLYLDMFIFTFEIAGGERFRSIYLFISGSLNVRLCHAL